MLKQLCLTMAALGGLLAATGSAFGQDSNREEVRRGIERDGWYVVWGETINEAEYAKFTGAMAASVAAKNPQPVLKYFENLVNRNIQRVRQQAPELAENVIRDLLLRALTEGGRTLRIGRVEVSAGIATYQRWNRVVYDEPRAHFQGLRSRVEMVRVERRIPLPNWHQPYVRIRFTR